MPKFLYLKYGSSVRSPYPWAANINVRRAEAVPCPVCGRHEREFVGTADVCLEKGSRWPDMLGVGSTGPFELFSERVIETWRKELNATFEAFPCRIVNLWSKKLSIETAPRYFYINVKGRIEIDLDESGYRERNECSMCKSFHLKDVTRLPERTVPIPESWSGDDLFRIRGGPWMLFCTDRVLELARQHRWTNFRFEMMDVLRSRSSGAKGIPYLGKKWPPEWYPPDPRQNRSALELVRDVLAEKPPSFATAYQALAEIGRQGDPMLIALLDHEEHPVRQTAANALYGYRDASPELRTRILSLVRCV